MAGIKIANTMSPTAVVGCADDVTIFITDMAELAIVENIINQFEKASRSLIYPHNSRALATGFWNTTDTIRGINFYQSAKIPSGALPERQWTTQLQG
jgi:hypothetical protein